MNLQEVMDKVNEANEEVAIDKALLSLLSTKFISTDGIPPESKIRNGDTPVSEASVELYVYKLEQRIKVRSEEIALMLCVEVQV